MIDKSKLIRSKEIVDLLIEGKNPFTMEELGTDSLMNEIKMGMFVDILEDNTILVKDELMQDWELARHKMPLNKIDPLI